MNQDDTDQALQITQTRTSDKATNQPAKQPAPGIKTARQSRVEARLPSRPLLRESFQDTRKSRGKKPKLPNKGRAGLRASSPEPSKQFRISEAHGVKQKLHSTSPGSQTECVDQEGLTGRGRTRTRNQEDSRMVKDLRS